MKPPLSYMQLRARHLRLGNAGSRPPAEQRPHAGERGYTSRTWRPFRDAQLRREPLCRACGQAGRLTPATDVDHIVPVQSSSDPRFYDITNLQSLCHGCHSRKTLADMRAGTTRTDGKTRSATLGRLAQRRARR